MKGLALALLLVAGVVHAEDKRPIECFGQVEYSREDNEFWWASQACVAELAPEAEREQLTRLIRIVDRMRHRGDNTPRAAIDGEPYTALLALVERIEAIADDPKTHCWLAGQTWFLLHGYDLPRIPADAISVTSELREYPIWDPDTYENVDECHAWIATFRAWLAVQRRPFEEGAAKESDAIAKARARY